MSGDTHASWGEWLAALERVLEDPSRIADEKCPSCGAHDLHIAFTGDEETRLGYASFWCNTSMDGIFTSRLHIPTGSDILPFGLPAEQRARIVPNYTIIPPAPIDGDDTEAAVF